MKIRLKMESERIPTEFVLREKSENFDQVKATRETQWGEGYHDCKFLDGPICIAFIHPETLQQFICWIAKTWPEWFEIEEES